MDCYIKTNNGDNIIIEIWHFNGTENRTCPKYNQRQDTYLLIKEQKENYWKDKNVIFLGIYHADLYTTTNINKVKLTLKNILSPYIKCNKQSKNNNMVIFPQTDYNNLLDMCNNSIKKHNGYLLLPNLNLNSKYKKKFRKYGGIEHFVQKIFNTSYEEHNKKYYLDKYVKWISIFLESLNDLDKITTRKWSKFAKENNITLRPWINPSNNNPWLYSKWYGFIESGFQYCENNSIKLSNVVRIK